MKYGAISDLSPSDPYWKLGSPFMEIPKKPSPNKVRKASFSFRRGNVYTKHFVGQNFRLSELNSEGEVFTNIQEKKGAHSICLP